MSKLSGKEEAHIRALEEAVDDIPTFDFSDDEGSGGEGDESEGARHVKKEASGEGGAAGPLPPPPPPALPSSPGGPSTGGGGPGVLPPSPPLKTSPSKRLVGGGAIFQSIRASIAGNATAIQQTFKRGLSSQQTMAPDSTEGPQQPSSSSPTEAQPDEVTPVMEMGPNSGEEEEEEVVVSPSQQQQQQGSSPPRAQQQHPVAAAAHDDYAMPYGNIVKALTEDEIQAMKDLSDRLLFKSEEVSNFSLLTNPHRALVLEGPVDKKGTEARIKRTNRRHLILLTDVLLIGELSPLATAAQGKKSSSVPSRDNKVTIKQVVELKHQTIYDRSAQEPLSFEVRGPHRAFVFLVDSQGSHAVWLKSLRSCLLALLQDTDIANSIGWQHTVFQGTYFSGALLGDLDLLRALEARDRKAITSGGGNKSEDDVEEERVEVLQAKDDEVGMAPIHFSAFVGQLGSLAFFLDQGCDPDLASDTLDTPLHYACSAGHYQAAALLVLRGASVHVKNFQDRTPLFEAVVTSEKNEDACAIVELLHRAGADLTTSDALGNTPIHKCALSGLVRMLATLLQLGADVNTPRETDQLTPIQVACMSEAPPEVLRLLIEHGALTNTALVGPRPLELLLTSRLYDSGDPGEATNSNNSNDGSSPSTTTAATSSIIAAALSPEVSTVDSQDAIYRRLPSILKLIRHGARTTTKKMVKAGVEASVIQSIQKAQAEWASKTAETTDSSGISSTGTSTALALDGGQAVLREEWAKDREKSRCSLCYATFSLMFRRHHCRLCGVLACANCSTKRLTIGSAATTSTTAGGGEAPKPDRVCDVCFNTTCRKMREAPPPPPPQDEAAVVVDEKEAVNARNRAELLGPGGAGGGGKEVEDAVARVKAGGRAYQKPTGKGGVGDVKNVMAETTQLMHERGEKLSRLADKTQQLQQSAMDFQEMAKQLAEREKNRKWWEF